ncbi:NAD-dependent epimerase/dehydratase family protein [Dactylosporangium sp. AC04546]|uniref:NAD-dependent epimerase/dehydratase family protein n=1 Tax=Dactylosporangium sp. AC04546 TaxID=2862460 RepID=UPI001EDE32D4|nr:NAD-dependent epimerase/dehydratase family protein [Dactylosporangium sp. AC04546]WVK84565.1 NAD-dependent epimerase/dehydratase family protein [Dactylosporangium sp. AC04546]
MTTPSAPRVVLVTGVGRYLGARLAARLAADRRIERVIGIDGAAPSGELAEVLDGVEVHQVDLRTPGVLRVMVDARVEAVAHLAVATAADQQGGRAAMKELNVIGTMQLLAACQQATRLTKLVVRSSTAAYGASFRDPAIFTEDTEPREVPRGGFAKDVLDIEGYVRGFRRRRPDVPATVLRFAPFIGSTVDTRLTRYFAQPVVPTVFGRDPRLQFLHVDDAFEVLHRSVVESHPGTYNVAGAGTLTLSQAVRRAGRVTMPVLEPGLNALAGLGRAGVSLDQLDLFVHGRVVDTARLIKEFGYTPRTTAEAFEEFVRSRSAGEILPADTIRSVEQALLDGFRRTRAARAALEAGSD